MKLRHLFISWAGAAMFCIENPFIALAGFAIFAYGAYHLGKELGLDEE